MILLKMDKKIENAADFQTDKDDVFGRIANRYDKLCDLFSFGIHRLWKRQVAKQIAQEEWETCLDLATGTGDIVLRLLKKLPTTINKKIIASDISPKMLEMAKQRLSSHNDLIDFQIIDATNIAHIPDSSIDLVSMSLGLKICPRIEALKEMQRVLKPDGKLIVLEASNIRPKWLNTLYLQYMNICMPLLGWIATGGDSSAYKYLLEGIKEFPTAEELKSEIETLGFKNVSYQRLSMGIVAIHTATKVNKYRLG